MRRPIAIGTHVRRAFPGPCQESSRRVGVVVGYCDEDPNAPLVGFGMSFDGHSGFTRLSTPPVPAKYQGHCWYIYYKDLLRLGAERKVTP